MGIGLDAIAGAASRFRGVPGRLERVEAGQAFDVLVDFAHTPAALERLLRSVRPETRGRLICVFGCGGDRDRTKRAPMGRVVEELADVVVVTSDNPRSEDPEAIIAEVLGGLARPDAAIVRADRREAIEAAISLARPGDTVVLAGKGHETEQIVGSDRMPFDDREVAREVLARSVER
jgi:UDP-N-acetylmuramoyl-L-alanyl-D-glutamate--2,6-diaminopimelate ligase